MSELLDRAVSAAFGHDIDARVARACRLYIEAGGERSFDDCLGLPKTMGKRRNLVRNHWLRLAQAELQSTGDDATARALHARLVVFVTRGPWLRWREAGKPPADAAALHRALWCAVAANGGRDLSYAHLAAILENCPRNARAPVLLFGQALTSRRSAEGGTDGAN